MISELTVSNYRSLGKDVRVRLGRLTALVGPNGCGKSNVLDALRFLADATQMGLAGAVTHRHGISAVRRWSAGHPFNLRIEVKLSVHEGQGRYDVELASARTEEYRVVREEASVASATTRHDFAVERGKWIGGPENLRPPVDETSLALAVVGGDERFKPLVQALRSVSVYAIFPDTLRTPQKYSPEKPMRAHGDNWVSVLKDQPEASWKPELVEALGRLTGDIVDVKVTPAASYLVAQFRHRTGGKAQKWFDAAQESDGTLRFAGILTALLQQPAVPVIGVEEPELTVHPGAVELLFDYLRQASRKSQIIVTTHSPELLDLFDTEDIRVVERKDGATVVAPLAEAQREAVRAGLLSLGELMRTEGLQQELPLGQDDSP